MDDVRTEWNLLKETWESRIPNRQKKYFQDFDKFLNETLFVPDFSELEKIIILSRRGQVMMSDDKKTIHLFKCPFTITAKGLKKEISTSKILTPVFDMWVNVITRKYPNIQVVNVK